MSFFQIDLGTEWRGGQRQSFLLTRILKERGWPAYLVCQTGSPLHLKAEKEGLSVLPIKVKSEFSPVSVVRLCFLMKKKGCLLAHYHDAHAAAVGKAASSLVKVPFQVLSRRVDFPLRKNPLSNWKYKNKLDAIIAISHGVKKVLMEGGINPDLIHVIPSGIDFSSYENVTSSDYLRKELSFKDDDYLVGIVAHLADHKGHRYFIEAAGILKKRAPKIKLIIVGEGPLKIELTKQVKKIQVDDMVFFLGFREDIPQILASLDLFVLSSYLEGLGSSLLDAMASRLPVVATKVGGIPEVVIAGETGLLVPSRNPEALAEAILELYRDREKASCLGERGYEVVQQKFSDKAMAGRIISLYQELALKKGIPVPENIESV